MGGEQETRNCERFGNHLTSRGYIQPGRDNFRVTEFGCNTADKKQKGTKASATGEEGREKKNQQHLLPGNQDAGVTWGT
jgi:hypothetical protein